MIARALSTHHGLVQVQVREFNADGTLDEASTSEPFSYTAGNPAARADGVLLTGFMNPRYLHLRRGRAG